MAKQNGYRSTRQASFWNCVTTSRANHKRIYCCFVDFQNTFDIVLRAQVMKQLEILDVPREMQLGIYAPYETVSRKVQSNGLLELVASTIGVK